MDENKTVKAFVKLPKWKKITLIAIGIIFAMRIAYIGIRGEVDKEYFTTTQFDMAAIEEIPCSNVSQTFVAHYDRIDSLELYFTGIADDKAGGITVSITRDEEPIYQAVVSLSNVNNAEWKKIFVNAELKRGDEYKVTLNANEDCTQIPNVVIVKSGLAPEMLQSYAAGEQIDGAIAINYGYLQFPGRLDRAVMISLWILLYGAIWIGVCHSEKIGDSYGRFKTKVFMHFDEKALPYFVEMIAALLIVYCSGIEFQKMTEIILYVISLIAVTDTEKKKAYLNKVIDSGWKRGVLFITYFYAAFALVGQRIWIYPLTLKPTAEKVFVFFVAVIWFIPIVRSILWYLELMLKSGFSTARKLNTPQFITLCSIMLVLPAAYNLFANNPGMSSPDTFYCMVTSAHHLHGTGNWHPAFYCMVLRAIQKVWDSTYAVILVQYFFWAYVVCEYLLYLRKKDVSDYMTIGISLFCGLNAGNFIHLNTIWKDIPYTLSLLWIFVIMAKLTVDFEEYKSKWYVYLEMVVALVGVYFYRRNGLVAFVIIMVCMVIFLRKNKKVIIASAVTIALVATIKGPVYTYFDVEDTGIRGMYHGLGQDILGAYYAGGEVSEKTLQMISMMTGYNNAEYSYNPTWSSQSYDVDVKPTEFVVNYVNTYIKNPIVMTRAIIDREDALWDIFAGQDSTLGCVNYTGTEDSVEGWNDLYNKRTFRSLYNEMSTATAYTASAQWLSAIEWRCGLFLLLGVVSVLFMIIKVGRGKYLVILSAPVGQIMSLLLSTGWSDFRYFWVMNLINLFMVALAVVVVREKGGRNSR